MNIRERYLLILVVSMLAIVVVFICGTRVMSWLDQKNTTISTLRRDVERKRMVLAAGSRATKQLAELQKRSLPADRERARSAYQEWLLQWIDQSGLRSPSVQPVEGSLRGGPFQQIEFKITGDASLEEITEFLYRFYRNGDLHRIQQLIVKPSLNSKELDVTVNVAALILPNAPDRTTIGNLESDRVADGQLEQFLDSIVGRNLFAPPNAPPRLDRIADQRAERGQPWSLTARSNDPNSDDQPTFSLVGESHGARVDPRSGSIRWTPREIGTFELTIQVADGGTPILTDTRTFEITVVEPPPAEVEAPRPAFDPAEYAFLVAITDVSGICEAWFSIRTTGDMLRLTEGAKLEVGSVQGVITRIKDETVHIDTESDLLQLRVGQNLAQAIAVDESAIQAALR